MYRFAHQVDGMWVEHSHSPVFITQDDSGSSQRILATVPGSDPEIVVEMAMTMPAPYVVLYVLHTPRGEAEPGRYQSEPMTAKELKFLFAEYDRFFRADGRFDLWVHAPDIASTVVWDQHNLLFAYGELEPFSRKLAALGFTYGEPTLPYPHEHYYREECDVDAASLLQSRSWRHSPLQASDGQ